MGKIRKWKHKFNGVIFATSPSFFFTRKSDADAKVKSYKAGAKRLKEKRLARIVSTKEPSAKGMVKGYRVWIRAEPKKKKRRR